MADQASVNQSRGNGNGGGESVVGSIAGFGTDVANLADLQLKLATLDFNEATAKATLPLSLLVGGLVVLLGSVPVAIAGAALLIASALGISLGLTLLLTAIVVMIAAGASVAFAGLRLTRSFEVFRRSREELVRNISWIRTVLVQSGRTPPKRRW